VQTYEAVPNTSVFREIAALRGEANERGARRARSGEGHVQSLPSHHPRQGGVRDFRRRGTRVRASPSLQKSWPGLVLRLRSENEHGWLARYLRRRKQAEKSITRTGVTTPRGRGSAARDRARGSVRVAEIGGKVAARRSASFIPLRRHDQGVGEGYAKRGKFRDALVARPANR